MPLQCLSKGSPGLADGGKACLAQLFLRGCPSLSDREAVLSRGLSEVIPIALAILPNPNKTPVAEPLPPIWTPHTHELGPCPWPLPEAAQAPAPRPWVATL